MMIRKQLEALMNRQYMVLVMRDGVPRIMNYDRRYREEILEDLRLVIEYKTSYIMAASDFGDNFDGAVDLVNKIEQAYTSSIEERPSLPNEATI